MEVIQKMENYMISQIEVRLNFSDDSRNNQFVNHWLQYARTERNNTGHNELPHRIQ